MIQVPDWGMECHLTSAEILSPTGLMQATLSDNSGACHPSPLTSAHQCGQSVLTRLGSGPLPSKDGKNNRLVGGGEVSGPPQGGEVFSLSIYT